MLRALSLDKHERTLYNCTPVVNSCLFLSAMLHDSDDTVHFQYSQSIYPHE
jgi:hypothetical protein